MTTAPSAKQASGTHLLLTPDEAAQSLRIKRTLLFHLLKTGKIASVKIGAARRIPIQALHDYVDVLCAIQKAG